MKRIITFSLLVFISFKLSAQTTRYVSSYSDLSSAISNSSSSVIDIIEIKNDITITQEFYIGKSITIKGNGHTLTVPVTGVSDEGVNNSNPSTFNIFNFYGSTTVATVENLTLKGGDYDDGGGCINNGALKLVLNSVTLSNGRNSGFGGGGGLSNSGDVYMTNCQLIRNSAGYGGGFLNFGTMYLEKTTFSDNRSESSNGGGGGCENQGTLYMNNCTFSNNKSTEIGGGINNYYGNLYILNSTFTGNVAYGDYQGGAIGMNGGTGYAINCIFAYNYYRTNGTVTDPSEFELDDFGNWDELNAFYCIYHSSANNFSSSSTGNIQYSGDADGSNNSIFAGGVYAKITDGTGTEIGTAKVFQPHLVSNATKTATLKLSSYPNQTSNKGTETGYSSNNGSPIVGYYNKATSSWVTLVGSNANSYKVTTDQLGTTRGTTPTRGSIETEINTVYMLKVLKSSNGASTGGSLYGDVYVSGTQITLTASPNTGYQFDYWKNTSTGNSVSTSNPYTLTLNADLTLEPVFKTASTTYTVTYFSNGASSGTAASPQSFTSGSITLAGQNTLVKDEYYFNGWNTTPSGSGTNYAAGATYSTTANLTLYAKWTPYVKFYIKSGSTTALTSTSNWTGNPDGTGGNPSNFGADKIFILDNTAGSTTFSTGASWSVDGALQIPTGKTLTITSGTTMTLSGDVINSATITGASGSTLILDGTTAQYLGGTKNLQAFEIDNTQGVTLQGATNVFGSLTLTDGVLTTGGHLTLKSNSSGTAIVNPVGSTASVSGNVTTEQYVPAKRAYRFISPTVTTTTSIYANWQESGSSTAGFGTHIAGSTTGANGFDQTLTGNASLFTFNNSNQTWSGIANTNSTTLTAGTPYRLMVRGDRTVSLATNTPTPTNTVIRATGTLFTGSKTVTDFNTTNGNTNFVGNPYQAPVDMGTVLNNSTNLSKTTLYIWDPKLSTRGGYTTVDISNNSATGGSAARKFLQPGQGCFVVSSGGSASLTFTEASKSTTLTSTWRATPPMGMYDVLLYQSDSLNAKAMPADGVLIYFDTIFSNDVKDEDATKFKNLDENMGIANQGKLLSIEKRNIPQNGDSIHLNITQYRDSKYTFVVSHTGDLDIEGYILDKYLNSLTPLINNGKTEHSFTVTTGTETANADRFSLVFLNSSSCFDLSRGNCQISPNPIIAGNEAKINLNGANNSTVEFELYSVTGSLIFKGSQKANEGEISVQMPELPAGVYSLRATANGKQFSQILQVR
jgi:uncharacterized repeat protein (TIGR02543 family)